MFRLKKSDFPLFLISVFILLAGTLTIGSVAPEVIKNHLISVFVSFIFFFVFSNLDLEVLIGFAPVIYLASLFLLILPFFFGQSIRGSIRWIPIGSFTFQPSEIVKPFIAIVLGWYWSKKNINLKNFFGAVGLILPPFVIIFLQPDFGSAFCLLALFWGSLFTLSFKKSQLLALVLFFIFIMPAFWFSLKDYQKARIIHFLNPYADPLGAGYNLIQAKITVGSGKLFGKGLGHGTQSHLYFLPERYTDFAFASFAEETGFIGVLVLILLYIFLFFRILKICFLVTSDYNSGSYFFTVSFGIFSYLFFQAIENIGMNIGLLPVAGIPLPLFSYGGSSLLSTMISLGILQNIFSKFSKKQILEIH